MPLVFLADGIAGWRRTSDPQPTNAIGLKAQGLFRLPGPWRPDFVVLTHDLLISLIGDATQPHRALRSLCVELIEALGRPAQLIVRSSATDETVENRGRYESYVVPRAVEQLAKTILKAWHTSTAHSTGKIQSRCPLVVQGFLSFQAKGHLSNEFRHAQRAVDFLFEAEECDAALGLRPQDPYSFKLERPVRPPRPLALSLGRFAHIENALQHVARWQASALGRGHIEWVVSSNRLWLVQFDPERPASKGSPLGAWLEDASRRFTHQLSAFRTLGKDETASKWRKTQSHHVITTSGLNVPPIYLLDDTEALRSALNDSPTPQLLTDLAALVTIPTMFRVDVDSSLADWTNLPVKGPISDPGAARTAIIEALRKTADRGARIEQMCIVAHHFLPAKASAWATAHPGQSRVKIDAIWGIPDGLQAFPYDTAVVTLNTQEVSLTERYKDKFIDVDTNGDWVTRSTPPALARKSVLSQGLALQVARDTQLIATSRSKPTRVMWFLQTDLRAGLGPAVPWILQDEDNAPDFWLESVDAASRETLTLIDRIQKRIKLGTVRRIETKEDFAEFKAEPSRFDAGGNCVLFRPSISLLRDKVFIRELAEHISAMSNWYLVLEGSLLAHAPYQLRSLGAHRIISIWEFKRPPRQTRIGKLVRDKVVDAIRAGGEVAAAMQLHPSTVDRALRAKLVEEALEALLADSNAALAEELGDVLTVMHALARHSGLRWKEIEQIERAKKRKRGGFDKALFLKTTGQSTGRPPHTSMLEPQQPVRRLRHRTGLALSLVPPVFPSREQLRFRFQFGDTAIYTIIEYEDREILLTLDTQGASSSPNQLDLFSDVPSKAIPRGKAR